MEFNFCERYIIFFSGSKYAYVPITFATRYYKLYDYYIHAMCGGVQCCLVETYVCTHAHELMVSNTVFTEAEKRCSWKQVRAGSVYLQSMFNVAFLNSVPSSFHSTQSRVDDPDEEQAKRQKLGNVFSINFHMVKSLHFGQLTIYFESEFCF